MGWCICKWATADWIAGETCNEGVEIDCDATDICHTAQGLFFSYTDYNTDLAVARACVKEKCADLWSQCDAANGGEDSSSVVPEGDDERAEHEQQQDGSGGDER